MGHLSFQNSLHFPLFLMETCYEDIYGMQVLYDCNKTGWKLFYPSSLLDMNYVSIY